VNLRHPQHADRLAGALSGHLNVLAMVSKRQI